MPKKKVIQLGEATRAVEFDAGKINRDNRTVPVVWSTGARVLRSSWDDGPWYEELSMDPQHVDMTRFESNTSPLLDDHNRYGGVRAVLGVVEDPVIQDGIGRANVRFSKRDDVEPIYQDVCDEIIRNGSVGYVRKMMQRMSDADDGIPVYRVIKWQPQEFSLTAIGADAGAGTRSANEKSFPCEIVERAEGAERGSEMPPENDVTKPAAAPAAPAAPVTPAQATEASRAEVDAARAEGSRAERQRVLDITTAVRAAGLDTAFGEELLSKGVTADAARTLIIEEFSKRGSKPSVTVTAGGLDEVETRRASIESSILHRFDGKKFALEKRAAEYMGLSLIEISRELLEARGEKVRGMSKDMIANRALSSSDLPSIVANVANKSLRDSYQSAPQTFRDFCRETELPDFKPVSRTQLGDAPALEAVGEDGTVKRGSISDGAETYQLGEYAKILPITRKTIINDDMGALTRIPMLMGRAAADLESDLVYTGANSLFGANSGGGAKLADGVNLFHASHANLAASGAVISVASIGAGRSAMRQQKNLQKRPINVIPMYILVPTAIETTADQFVSQALLANQSSTVNPFAGKLKVIAEPRLDAISATAWYLLAQYSQIDIIEIAYLQGQKGVYFETKQGFDVEGMEFKARLDVAVKWIDYRGAYKNPGA